MVEATFTGKKATFKAVEYSHLYLECSESISKGHISVGWKPPPLGWWKLNTNGSCQGSMNQIGGGGILRDSNGNWVHGFAKFFGEGNSLMAELRAIIEGLKAFYQVKVVHIHRERNACADILTKQAINSQTQLMYFDKMPSWLSSSFLADLVGVEFDRASNSVVV
ncbi:ribonuclease H [Senna tora]|uniref:Ribonuclease H n=1 Tax=Senna tora TaxID=362788 RepID=A0A834X1N5_9FABA|nr:ribonuclease H [Senna tora]